MTEVIEQSSPSTPLSLLSLAMAAHRQGDSVTARQYYEQSIQIETEPSHQAEAWHFLGLLECQSGQIEQGWQCYERSHALAVTSGLLSDMGLACAGQNQFETAATYYQRAIDLDANCVAALNNMSTALTRLGQPELALTYADRALAINPQLVSVYINKGGLLKTLNRVEEAEQVLLAGLKIEPNNDKLRWSMALVCLFQQRWDEGWEYFEARKSIYPEFQPYKQLPVLWDGRQSLDRKTILIFDEQGLGDSILFSRFIPLLVQLGANVVIESHPPLKALYQGQFTGVKVIAKGEERGQFDYHQTMMSLPRLLNIDGISKIPFPYPYIRCHADRLEMWRGILGEKQRPRIGLAWLGSLVHPTGQNRNVPFEQLADILDERFEYVCLMPSIPEQDQARVKQLAIRTFEGQILDMADTAAICYQLDLVISIDTSILHLASAMGKPTWGMMVFTPDWRWLKGRQDSPWYRSLRLFKQQKEGEWAEVISAIRQALSQFFPQ